MDCPLFILVVIGTLCCRSALGKNNDTSSLESVIEKQEALLMKVEALTNVMGRVSGVLEDIRNDLTAVKEDQALVKESHTLLKQDQEDLKQHMLDRLDALDEKTAWCLSDGHKGEHPLNNRMKKIEQQNKILTAVEQLTIKYKDCKELLEAGYTESGRYWIFPDGKKKKKVYCEQKLDGGGWLVHRDCRTAYNNGYRTSGMYMTFPHGTMMKVYCEQEMYNRGWMVHRDCQQALDRGFNKSGTYMISPDGKEKEKVYCEQVLNGGGWKVPKDCEMALAWGMHESKVYWIVPDGTEKMRVFCEQELYGGGWIIIQHRRNGSVDFDRGWADYRTGFGNLSGEFWLGNDNLHQLTKGTDHKLRIELTNNARTAFVDYTTFWIGDESRNYALFVRGSSRIHSPSNKMADILGVIFSHHNQGIPFMTKDHLVNRYHLTECSEMNWQTWWSRPCMRMPHCARPRYRFQPGCHGFNPNGAYIGKKGIEGHHRNGSPIYITGTRMMVKRKH